MIKNKENWRSMIEMLGVLAVIGVLSIGGIAGYSKAMTKYRINKTIEQITLIAGNVRSFFGPKKTYLGARCHGDVCTSNGCYGHKGISSDGAILGANNGCPIIRKAKIIPDEMLILSDDGTKIISITNTFGYPVQLYSTTKSSENDNLAFVISYSIGDNIEACIELVTQDWSSADIKAINIQQSFFKTPVSIDLATKYCYGILNRLTSDNKAQGYPNISFYFDIDLNSSYWSSITWKN